MLPWFQCLSIHHPTTTGTWNKACRFTLYCVTSFGIRLLLSSMGQRCWYSLLNPLFLFRVHLVTSDRRYMRYSWSWETTSSYGRSDQDDGLVAVVDGGDDCLSNLYGTLYCTYRSVLFNYLYYYILIFLFLFYCFCNKWKRNDLKLGYKCYCSGFCELQIVCSRLPSVSWLFRRRSALTGCSLKATFYRQPSATMVEIAWLLQLTTICTTMLLRIHQVKINYLYYTIWCNVCDVI